MTRLCRFCSVYQPPGTTLSIARKKSLPFWRNWWKATSQTNFFRDLLPRKLPGVARTHWATLSRLWFSQNCWSYLSGVAGPSHGCRCSITRAWPQGTAQYKKFPAPNGITGFIPASHAARERGNGATLRHELLHSLLMSTLMKVASLKFSSPLGIEAVLWRTRKWYIFRLSQACCVHVIVKWQILYCSHFLSSNAILLQ